MKTSCRCQAVSQNLSRDCLKTANMCFQGRCLLSHSLLLQSSVRCFHQTKHVLFDRRTLTFQHFNTVLICAKKSKQQHSRWWHRSVDSGHVFCSLLFPPSIQSALSLFLVNFLCSSFLLPLFLSFLQQQEGLLRHPICLFSIRNAALIHHSFSLHLL